jgi:hypothetical protein
MTAKKNNISYIYLWIIILILASLACGSVQVGVVTPTAVDDAEPISEVQETQTTATPEGGDTQTEEETVIETPPAKSVTAWLGHIASLPDGSQYEDMVVLSPPGTGEFGITGTNPEIEAEIRTLRDAEGPNEFVHLWGSLSCNVEDYNNCQLNVDRLQYGANYSEEGVKGWIGTIKSHTFNSVLSYVFELEGEFPMWYSIYASQDEGLKAQIEDFRDTGAIVMVSGKLMVGVPDVNGTRIEAFTLELIEAGSTPQSALDDSLDPTAEWPTFVNNRYGYQIKYPIDATISLYGPQGFPGEDLPEGMTPEQYMDSLQKEYTDRLCVQIEYALGWIYIAAPPNKEFRYTPCGPTGVGAGEVIPKIESVFIGDQLFEATGHEIKLKLDDGSGGVLMGETLDLHYEMFMVELEDGTVIRFGALPRHDATYEDYLMKTKDTLLEILSTFEANP